MMAIFRQWLEKRRSRKAYDVTSVQGEDADRTYPSFLFGIGPQILVILLLLGAISAALFLVIGSRDFIQNSMKAHITSNLVVHSQRIGKAVPNALRGNYEAFHQLEESRREFGRGLNLLRFGGAYQGYVIEEAEEGMQLALQKTQQIWESTDRAAVTLIRLKNEITSFGKTQHQLNMMSPVLLELTGQMMQLQDHVGMDVGQNEAEKLVLLTLKLNWNMSELLSESTSNPDVMMKDVQTFGELMDVFLRKTQQRSVAEARYAALAQKLKELRRVFGEYRAQITPIIGSLPQFIEAKKAEITVSRENETLKDHLMELSEYYRLRVEERSWTFWPLQASLILALLSGLMLTRLRLQHSRANEREAELRREEAEAQKRDAQYQEERAMQENVANQRAIARMNEDLQKVAEGDLTVHIEVRDGITGEIADSMNYTIDALRGLVGQVTNLSSELTGTLAATAENSAELVQMSKDHSQNVTQTTHSVQEIAREMGGISGAAGESAKVARRALEVAEHGASAVESTVRGMDEIREQIQETSKRIKRLGESSQEIGEITALIADITEQTHVLALNAAIQAASAGEAGRGFSVVAEEVQRLAERSSAATRQIGALVRTIQMDTSDAISAMEKSTAGVVEGARLSDAAGTSIADIRRVSNELADLIQGISDATHHQANLASLVEGKMDHLHSTQNLISERRDRFEALFMQLSSVTSKLKESVTRFTTMIP